MKDETGVGTLDVKNRLSDFGVQGYWLSHHPWIVPEPFTPEPCETYSKADLDYWAAAMRQAVKEAYEDPDFAKAAPHAQAVGKIATRVDDLGVDLLSIAGHKLYAPKGVGALYIRRGTPIEPLIHGAGHESGRRAGTESALMTAALGAACALAGDLEPMRDIRTLRDDFWRQLHSLIGDQVVLNGHPEHRLPNTLDVSFVGRTGAEVLAALDGVAASTGSACHSGRVELSPVLRAMGTPPDVGMGAVRFSLGRGTTKAEIDAVAGMIRDRVAVSGR